MARVLNLYFYFQFVKSGCPFVSDGRINCNSNLSDFGKSETILTLNLMQKCIYTIDQVLLCACHVYLNAKVLQPFNICVLFSMVKVRIFI